MGNGMHFFENSLHIGGKVHRFGENDDVEYAIQFQILACHDVEFPHWDQRASGGNLFLSNIDADDIAVRKKREKMSSAAANFEHACRRRDQVSIVVGQQFSVKTTAFRRLCRSRLIKRAKLAEMLLEQRRNRRRRQNAERVPTENILMQSRTERP